MNLYYDLLKYPNGRGRCFGPEKAVNADMTSAIATRIAANSAIRINIHCNRYCNQLIMAIIFTVVCHQTIYLPKTNQDN